ncbi:MAG: mechanosensitive ion channel family protein [Candidatus Eisenbacteria bacterium]
MNEFWNSIDLRLAIPVLVAFLPRLIVALFVLFAFWVGYRVIRRPLRAILGRSGMAAPLVHLLVDNVVRFSLLAFALVMAASQVGINVGAALAGIGVAGIAIGFAAQDSLSNTIAGFMIFWDKPFAVHDWVEVGGEFGQVTEITLRSTRIRTMKNTYVVIPNKNIIDQVLTNHTKHGETRIDVPIGIAYKEFIPEARRVLLEAVKGVEGPLANPAPDVVVIALGGSSVDLLVRVWTDDSRDEARLFSATLEACKLALDEAGIQIPYPHLQLFVDNVEERVWEKAARLGRGPSV